MQNDKTCHVQVKGSPIGHIMKTLCFGREKINVLSLNRSKVGHIKINYISLLVSDWPLNT